MKHNISHIQDAYEKYLTLSFNPAAATPNKWVDAAGLKEKVGGFGFSKMKTIFFESTTSWVAPVTGVAIVIAIGGGGAASGGSSYAPSGGGGGSGHISIGTANVIKNTSYPITVGAGGKPGIKDATVNSPTAGAPGSDGGFSSAYCIAEMATEVYA